MDLKRVDSLNLCLTNLEPTKPGVSLELFRKADYQQFYKESGFDKDMIPEKPTSKFKELMMTKVKPGR